MDSVDLSRTMRTQDASLDALLDSIVRVKEVSTAIGAALEDQGHLIDAVDTHVAERSAPALRHATRRVERLDAADARTRCLWYLIGALAFCLLFVVVLAMQ